MWRCHEAATVLPLGEKKIWKIFWMTLWMQDHRSIVGTWFDPGRLERKCQCWRKCEVLCRSRGPFWTKPGSDSEVTRCTGLCARWCRGVLTCSLPCWCVEGTQIGAKRHQVEQHKCLTTHIMGAEVWTKLVVGVSWAFSDDKKKAALNMKRQELDTAVSRTSFPRCGCGDTYRAGFWILVVSRSNMVVVSGSSQQNTES